MKYAAPLAAVAICGCFLMVGICLTADYYLIKQLQRHVLALEARP